MTAIRSLADELREKMRQDAAAGADEKSGGEATAERGTGKKKKAGKPPPGVNGDLETLLTELSGFALNGNEKLLIRLDNRTVFLLKQLKVSRSIDMNKLIAYSVDAFFKSHPELIEFIRSTLQTIEL